MHQFVGVSMMGSWVGGWVGVSVRRWLIEYFRDSVGGDHVLFYFLICFPHPLLNSSAIAQEKKYARKNELRFELNICWRLR